MRLERLKTRREGGREWAERTRGGGSDGLAWPHNAQQNLKELSASERSDVCNEQGGKRGKRGKKRKRNKAPTGSAYRRKREQRHQQLTLHFNGS